MYDSLVFVYLLLTLRENRRMLGGSFPQPDAAYDEDAPSVYSRAGSSVTQRAASGYPEDSAVVMNSSEVYQQRLLSGGNMVPIDTSMSPESEDANSTFLGSTTSINSFLDHLPGSRSASRGRRMYRVLYRLLTCVVLLFLPFYIGVVLAMFSWERKKRRLPLFINDKDWMVLAYIGVMMQLSLLCMLANVLPGARDVFHTTLKSPSDYYGPFAIYPISSIFFCLVAVAYAVLDKKSQRKRRLEVSLRRRTRLIVIYTQMTESIKIRSERIVPAAFALSLVLILVCRFCNEAQSRCLNSDAKSNQLWDPLYYTEPFFFASIGFQFAQYSCLLAFTALAVMMYMQHYRLVHMFTFPDRTSGGSVAAAAGGARKQPGSPQSPANAKTRLLGSPRGKTFDSPNTSGPARTYGWHDLSHPEGISMYHILYHHIVGSMNNHPVIRSICTPAFAICILLFFGSVAVVVVDNLYQRNGIADFTFVFFTFMVIGATVVVAFIALTVQLDKTISLQSRIIAKAQHDVQLQVDAARLEPSSSPLVGHTMKMLEAKVNALQALDVFVRHADSTPKLIGMSLNTIRWTTIFSMLLCINAFFIVLYRLYCFSEAPRVITRTQTQTLRWWLDDE